MDRVVFHIDVNSAFVSWSAVKILSEGGQDIRLVPSVVSGDPSDRRSIVTAKSIPCKKFGINTAEPVSMALRKCPGLVIVRGDWEWYKRCSNNFIAICRTYSPILQQFSVDECFIEMTGRLEGKDPVAVAHQLREEIKARLGFTVNVGVGSNKLLAKMASDFEKPDKVHTLWSSEVQEKMWPLQVRDLDRSFAAKAAGHLNEAFIDRKLLKDGGVCPANCDEVVRTPLVPLPVTAHFSTSFAFGAVTASINLSTISGKSIAIYCAIIPP